MTTSRQHEAAAVDAVRALADAARQAEQATALLRSVLRDLGQGDVDDMDLVQLVGLLSARAVATAGARG